MTPATRARAEAAASDEFMDVVQHGFRRIGYGDVPRAVWEVMTSALNAALAVVAASREEKMDIKVGCPICAIGNLGSTPSGHPIITRRCQHMIAEGRGIRHPSEPQTLATELECDDLSAQESVKLPPGTIIEGLKGPHISARSDFFLFRSSGKHYRAWSRPAFVEGLGNAQLPAAPVPGQEPTDKPGPSPRPVGEPRNVYREALVTEIEVLRTALSAERRTRTRHELEALLTAADAAAAALPPCPGVVTLDSGRIAIHCPGCPTCRDHPAAETS
jgi:hypothetical protein